jgi:ribosomal protein S27E
MDSDEVFVKCPKCENVKFTFSYALLKKTNFIACECSFCGSTMRIIHEKDCIMIKADTL